MSKSLIDATLIKKLQMYFCKSNDVYMTCVDREYGELAACYGDTEEKEFFAQLHPLVFDDAFAQSILLSQVETITELETGVPYLKECIVVDRVKDSVAVICRVLAVIREKVPADVCIPEQVAMTSEKRFYRSIALWEQILHELVNREEAKIRTQENLEHVISEEEKRQAQMCRSESMTKVVRLMESEEDTACILQQALQETCDVLEVAGGSFLRVSADGKVSRIAEYSADTDWCLGEKLEDKYKKDLPFADGKTYILSSDSMMRKDLEKFFVKYHLSAAFFSPIEKTGKEILYFCMYEFEKSRIWSMEDIKFINDVRRVVQKILENRETKDVLMASYTAMEEILENLGCAVYVADYEKKEVLYTNKEFRRLTDADTRQTGMENPFFANVHMDREFSCGEVHLENPDHWLEVRQEQVVWRDGRTVSLGTIYDITDKIHSEQELKKQISNDALTGLYNRIRCENDLEHYIAEAEKNGQEGAFLCIDLDDFQNINDGLGHQYGDMLLKAIAQNLIRVAGIENHCYRMSGDEFAVIVHGDAYKSLSRVCKDLRKIFERPWFLKNEDYYCTMSMGVVEFPTDGNTAEDLIRKVNIALSTAKKKGKNCVEFYNEKVEDAPFYRLDMEQNLRRATLNSCNEFEVYYQPILSFGKENNVCCGAEALVRWNSAELGFIPPNDFIPLAEYLGLINVIGDHVLTEAVKRCKYWNDCGYPDYKVNVNISVIQLLQPDFASKVHQILYKSNIDPKNVTLEVTESLAINDMNRMKTVLKQIKDLGVGVALDDFGTGYSSLNHIRELPIDVIKIDRCFAENLAEDEFSGAFVKMVAELAKTIGVKVCVEGVEQKKQLAALKDMPVSMVQGYYFGKPMTAREFEKIYLK